TGAVWVQVTTPAHELDIQQITVTVRRQGDNHLLKHQVFDYETRNKAYGGDPAVLDMPDLDGILVQPHAFTTPSTLYVVDVQFHDVFALGPVHIEACALDVHSNRVCTTTSGVYGINLYLPLIRIP
ncbi:MAG: hypothetical protein GY792_10105, partial [Gammaproteobacteria bacterium]|nr:hypothetical protein [Gammaproteobacteria bacterium]